MPTITVRLDDETRDALQSQAEGEGVTVSDFVRDLIRTAVVPIREEDERDGYTPDSMTAKERHVLSLLHRILARVLPADANDVDGDAEYQLERAKVLEAGFTQEYWTEYAGIAPELSKRDAKFVMDVLDMFRMIDYSVAELQKTDQFDEELVNALRFRGFDHNDPLESKMANYVEFLVGDGRWEERADFLNGPERGNSHHPMIDTYSRMLAEYRRIREEQARRPAKGRVHRRLRDEDLLALRAARIHPDNR
ncbi:YfbU family protein [Curtobacterium sp. RHCKG23]|uniref:YfbU family protein n=1 Tax=Curtobacterium citri TaxID=3055139 RepID=A0ABT7TAF7_9MICO|nr:YfbU family protein [Curtobacterium citri]MDM7886571.1 YfbU family protein [Curtobacterium citri]